MRVLVFALLLRFLWPVSWNVLRLIVCLVCFSLAVFLFFILLVHFYVCCPYLVLWVGLGESG